MKEITVGVAGTGGNKCGAVAMSDKQKMSERFRSVLKALFPF